MRSLNTLKALDMASLRIRVANMECALSCMPIRPYAIAREWVDLLTTLMEVRRGRYLAVVSHSDRALDHLPISTFLSTVGDAAV